MCTGEKNSIYFQMFLLRCSPSASFQASLAKTFWRNGDWPQQCDRTYVENVVEKRSLIRRPNIRGSIGRLAEARHIKSYGYRAKAWVYSTSDIRLWENAIPNMLTTSLSILKTADDLGFAPTAVCGVHTFLSDTNNRPLGVPLVSTESSGSPKLDSCRWRKCQLVSFQSLTVPFHRNQTSSWRPRSCKQVQGWEVFLVFYFI